MPLSKRPPEKPISRLDRNIEIDFRGVGCRYSLRQPRTLSQQAGENWGPVKGRPVSSRVRLLDTRRTFLRNG
jgi:hypothetical protein